MASSNELIYAFYKRIVESNYSVEETKKVLNDINNLTYENTDSIISKEDKLKILKGLYKHSTSLLHSEHRGYFSYRAPARNSLDDSDFTELIKIAITKAEK